MIEKEIIEQCIKGNLHNFRLLVEKATPYAYSVAFRIMGNTELADEIVQETMITIWKKIGKLKSAETFRTWMYRIVVNKCYDELRKKKTHPEFVTDDATWERISGLVSENPGKEMDNRELAVLIESLTVHLSPRQKTVFVLADLEEMSNDEISLVTGMSRLNVKANLHYARKSIGEMIRKHL